VNVTLSIDEQTMERARKRAGALGKSLNQLNPRLPAKLAGGDDADCSIQEFERGTSNSHGVRFNQAETHERS
jgi:hypothetical protein